MAISRTTTGQKRARLLLVDDEPEGARLLGEALANDHCAYELALSGSSAMQAVERQKFDLVIADVRMPGMSGLELLDRLVKSHPLLPVVLLTGQCSVVDAVDATKRGAFQYLSKPCNVLNLQDVIAKAIGQPREAAEWRRTSAVADGSAQLGPMLLGREPAMIALQDAIEKVAQSGAPVLICGESGSGKDVVAHAIHARGPRRASPFVALNVSAIPEPLLESEIFGYVRGAFTGASQSRRGLFAEADGGTLFLDEIGDMPLGLQAKMLRVLQFGEIRPVGSDVARRVDVRILAATHRDLPSCIESGHFREDLYFRLNVLPIMVPPLRSRRRDIAALATHFLEQARLRMPTSPVRSMSPKALECLSRADWKGNVRELASVIERLVVFGPDETIEESSLSFLSHPAAAIPAVEAPLGLCTLHQLNERHVGRVLERTEGNKVRAAEILGINLSTLYRWCQRPKAAVGRELPHEKASSRFS